MDIELLRTFLEVNNTRHFGKAAHNLYITQAAVSSRIKLLEQMLGTPLFMRHRNNLQLTDTGERLVTHAEDIIKAWENAKKDIALRQNSKTIIRFGATTGFCAIILEQSLGPIYRTVQGVAMRAESLDEETLLSRLRERRIDLALLFDSSKQNDYVSLPLTSAELILVSTRMDDSPQKALREGYVEVDWGAFFSVQYQKMYPEAGTPVLQTSLSRIAMEFILENSGSAFLPYRLAEPHLGRGLHRVEDAPVIHQPMYATYHKEHPHVAQMQAIIEVIKEHTQLMTAPEELGVLSE